LFFLFCILVGLFSPLSLLAAGFNCTKASSTVEKMICGNEEISRLDDDMNAAYKEASLQSLDKVPLVMDQKLWLKRIRNICKDAGCLVKVYQQRIVELKKWNEPAPNNRDIFGSYSREKEIKVYNPDPDNDKFELVKSTDSLTITNKANGGRIGFQFSLIGANARTCEMSGDAVLIGSAYQANPDKTDSDYPKDCNLKIRIKRNTILLEDEDDGCFKYFCVMGFGINGTEFGRKQKKR